MSRQNVLYVTICQAVKDLNDEGIAATSDNLKNKLQWEVVETQQFSDRANKASIQGYLKAVVNKNRVNRSDTKIFTLTKKGQTFLDENQLQVQDYGFYEVTDIEGDLFAPDPLNPVDQIVNENKRLVANLKAIRIQLLKSLMVDSDNG